MIRARSHRTPVIQLSSLENIVSTSQLPYSALAQAIRDKMTLFNNLSRGSPSGDGDSRPPPGVFGNRKCSHQRERLLGGVGAEAGGAALRAEQVLSDLVSSPPLPSPGSAPQTDLPRPPCAPVLQPTRGLPTFPGDAAAKTAKTATPPLPGKRRPAAWPCREPAGPCGGEAAGPSWGLPDGAPRPRSLPTAPAPPGHHHHRPPHSEPPSSEHPSGVTGPLQSKGAGHPLRSPWPPPSPPCSRPLPTPLAGPGDARVGTLRTPL